MLSIETLKEEIGPSKIASNSNFANFNNNIHRTSKWPKSNTTSITAYDRESETFELFEDLFQTSLKIHNQQTEDNIINFFHSFIKGGVLQTSENLSRPNWKNPRKILAVFRGKYVKPQSTATAKHNSENSSTIHKNKTYWIFSKNSKD